MTGIDWDGKRTTKCSNRFTVARPGLTASIEPGRKACPQMFAHCDEASHALHNHGYQLPIDADKPVRKFQGKGNWFAY